MMTSMRRGLAMSLEIWIGPPFGPLCCLSGRTGDACPTAPKDAGITEAGPGRRIGITILGDGGGGPSEIPPTGGEPRGLSNQTASTSRNAGCRSAPADSEAGREGGPGRYRHDHAPPLDPDSAVGAGIKRIAGSALRRHWIKAEPRLSFAF